MGGYRQAYLVFALITSASLPHHFVTCSLTSHMEICHRHHNWTSYLPDLGRLVRINLMTRDSFGWLSIWSSSQSTGVVAAHIQSGAVSTVISQWIRVSVSYEKWEDVCQARRGHTAPMFLGVRFIDWSPALCPFHPLTHSIPYQDTCMGRRPWVPKRS